MKSARLLFLLASLPPPPPPTPTTDDGGEEVFRMFFFFFFSSHQVNANSFLKVASLHPGGRFSSWQGAASPGPAFGRRRFLQALNSSTLFFFFLQLSFGLFFFSFFLD